MTSILLKVSGLVKVLLCPDFSIVSYAVRMKKVMFRKDTYLDHKLLWQTDSHSKFHCLVIENKIDFYSFPKTFVMIVNCFFTILRF